MGMRHYESSVHGRHASEPPFRELHVALLPPPKLKTRMTVAVF